MTELAQRYRIFSGLLFFDVDKEIANCKPEKLSQLYRKLCWNIQKGIRLDPRSDQGKEYAWIICNLAVRCGIDYTAENIIKDNIVDFNDFITHYELEFAHKVINDCEHLDIIVSYLLLDPEGEDFLVLEDEEGKIMLDY